MVGQLRTLHPSHPIPPAASSCSDQAPPPPSIPAGLAIPSSLPALRLLSHPPPSPSRLRLSSTPRSLQQSQEKRVPPLHVPSSLLVARLCAFQAPVNPPSPPPPVRSSAPAIACACHRLSESRNSNKSDLLKPNPSPRLPCLALPRFLPPRHPRPHPDQTRSSTARPTRFLRQERQRTAAPSLSPLPRQIQYRSIGTTLKAVSPPPFFSSFGRSNTRRSQSKPVTPWPTSPINTTRPRLPSLTTLTPSAMAAQPRNPAA